MCTTCTRKLYFVDNTGDYEVHIGSQHMHRVHVEVHPRAPSTEH